MASKVISLHFPEEKERDAYIERLKGVASELQEIAEHFGEPLRSVQADLTYIVIGDDIMSTIQSMDEQ